ncbi:MAG: caspase family protein [Nitrospira sp.]
MASPRTAPAVRLLSCGVSSTVAGGRNAIITIGQAVIPEKQLNHTGFVAGAWLGCTLLFLGACAGHLEFPSMGDPLPSSAKLETSPSLKELTLRYSDSCGQLQELSLGDRLQEALQEGIRRTFKTVMSDGGDGTTTPDHVIQVDLVDSSFNLNKEALYDRAPASLQLNAVARIYDRKGTLLRQTDIKIARQERLRLEQLAKNCNYMIEPFIHDAVIDFAVRVVLNARSAVGGQEITLDSAEPNPSTVPPSSASASSLAEQPRSPALPPSALRFKAMLLDENSNLILEGGEHVRVRLDVINTGIHPIEDASASLTGTPAVIEQFPTTRLKIPPLSPGQTKSLEFVATLPLLTQPLRAEIHVRVAESDGSAAPSQTLLFTVAPTKPRSDDIDELPAQASTLQQRHIYLVSIGLSSYLDRRILSRKYASRDAETVARYFQTFGGVPSSNIHLLVDWKAFHSHMEKAFSGWLRSQPTSGAVVIVYFSGHAMVSQAGEVMLIPYDGASTATTLYPLKAIESVLAKLNAKQAILIFDGNVSQLQGGSEMNVTPRWDLTGGNTIRLIAGEGLSHRLDDDSHQHGLFTYYLLRGLRGEADSNRNGEVTLGEITDYVRQKVTWASKSQFESVQRPQVIPALKAGATAASLVLTALPSLTASETP